MPTIKNAAQQLMGTNSIQLICSYSESITGGKNKVTFAFKVWTKWKLDGTWRTTVSVNGTSLMDRSVTYNHGSYTVEGGETTVLSTSKEYTYSGTKTMNVTFKIINMDYHHYTNPTVGYFSPTLSQNITLGNIVTNVKPTKPTLSITNANAKGDKYYPENSFTVSLSGSTDPDGDTIKYIIDGSYKAPASSDWVSMGNLLSSYDSKSANVDITGYTRGTQFKVSGYTWDKSLSSDKSTEHSNIYRNKKPDKVSSINPNGGVFGADTFKVTWPGITDPDGHTITYKIWLSTSSGGYVRQNDNSSPEFTFSTSSGDEGKSYKLKIVATDGITDSDVFESPSFTRNQKPSVPKGIGPSSGYFLNSVTATWNASTDPDGQTIQKYNVYMNDTFIGSSTSTSYTWNIPGTDAEGQLYKISVEAVDALGLKSAKGYASGSFSKPVKPSNPTWSKPTAVYHINEIELGWANQTSNGTEVFYKLEYKANTGNWTSLSSKLQKNSYNFDISTHTRGTSYQFRVKAFNSFEMESSWVNSITCYRNRLPTTPTIEYPKTWNKVYGNIPRICFKIYNEPDTHSQAIYVNLKCANPSYDSTFNNVNHPALFSTKTSSSTAKNIVFSCPELKNGNYEVYVYTNDGYENSSRAGSVMVIADSGLTVESNNLIEGSKFTEIKKYINLVRVSYGKTNYEFKQSTAKDNLIKFSSIDEMRTAMLDVRTFINNYDSNIEASKKRGTTWTSSGKDNYITSVVVQEIINMVKNP